MIHCNRLKLFPGALPENVHNTPEPKNKERGRKMNIPTIPDKLMTDIDVPKNKKAEDVD